MLDTNNTIEVQGARVHNLKNIDISIPRELAFLPVVQNGKHFEFISKSVALEANRTKLKSITIK